MLHSETKAFLERKPQPRQLTNIFILVAHGRVVTSSRQITEVKQRRARLVLGWVTAARVTLPAMCRGVGQAFHIMPPLSTQQ